MLAVPRSRARNRFGAGRSVRAAVPPGVIVPAAVLSLLLALGPLLASAVDWTSIAVSITRTLLAW